MAGLPKKYAKMGFKKGWAAYKATKKQKTGVKKFYSRIKESDKYIRAKSRGAKVAKKRKTYKKKAKQKGGMDRMLNTATNILLPVGYGWARDRMSDGLNTLLMKTGIGQKLPVTEFTDEAVMLAASWGVGKLGGNKNPLGRKALKIINIVEKARIGQTISDIQQTGRKGDNNAFWN